MIKEKDPLLYATCDRSFSFCALVPSPVILGGGGNKKDIGTLSPNDPHKPQRTIDERLDALAIAMELQAGMLRDLDANIEKLTANVDKLTARQSDTAARQSETDTRLDRLTGIVETLAGIVQSHERRITSFESGQSEQ